MLVLIIALLVLLCGSAAATATRREPVVEELRLHQRIVAQGDDLLLSWRVRHVRTITVRDGGGRRHTIPAWRGEGLTPLPVRSAGWLWIEVTNGSHTVRRLLGPVRLVTAPSISHVTIGDPDLHSIADADVEGLVDGLARVAGALPDWRTAKPPSIPLGPEPRQVPGPLEPEGTHRAE